MTAGDWSEIADLFAEALEQPPPERLAFLEERCAGRPELLSAVKNLLAADQKAGAEFLQQLDPALLGALSSEPAPLDSVGVYRLIRPIGAGGMGQVYLAERSDGQFERDVAVKLLKRGMDSDAILTRFLRERQILARLDHPHIASLLDGGIAADGRPYLVMELVDGIPIDQYCDNERLDTAARVKLMRTVCLAVEYAHRNLVVHRDLKPSNILVTSAGEPKLLDFGIAKLLSGPDDAAEATTLTQSGGRPLTPEYAAPEQFRGEPVTTSTDVFSLGAVLYQLVTGERPFPERGEKDPSAGDREREPPTASSRVRDSDRRKAIAGDLDLILARALRSNPERRYPSVEAFREDLRRNQERLPIKARPDSLGYRASRFVRRHRTAVLLSGALGALIMLFAGIAAMQAIRIGRQSRELTRERDRARAEASVSEEVTDFLVSVFEVSDPQVEGPGDSLTARDLLDRGAARIDTGLAGQPELQARLLGVIGQAYTNLLLPQRAEPLLERGVALWRVGGGDRERLIVARQRLAETRSRIGDFTGAERALREALPEAGAKRWQLYVDLATMFHAQGAVDRARGAVDTALLLYRNTPADVPHFGREDLHRVASLMRYTRQWTEMDSAYARLIAIGSRERGPRSGTVAQIYNFWAAGRATSGERTTADSLHRLALGIQRELSPRSVAVARTLGLLASNDIFLGLHARADSQSAAAIEIYREHLGEDHLTVAGERGRRAETLRHLGRHNEAVRLLEQVVAAYRRSRPASPTLLPGAEWRLAVALRDAGRPRQALTPFRSALADFEKRYAADFLSTAYIRRDYGEALLGAGQPREAERQLKAAVASIGRRFGPEDPRTESVRITLGRAIGVAGRRFEADSLLAGVERRMAVAKGATDSLVQRARAARAGFRRAGSVP
jgi:serine/threonine-protein kinase